MDFAEPFLNHCVALIEAGRLAEADEEAQAGLSSFPDHGMLWQLHGLLLHRMKDLSRAQAALETASVLVPLEPAARCALADCYAAAGRRNLAGELYLELADDAGCPVSLFPAIAAGVGGLGFNEAALSVCDEWCRRDASSPEAWFTTAFYVRRLGGLPGDVLPMVRRAHTLAPDVPIYRVTLASLLAVEGELHAAHELLRDLDPNRVRCGCCLRRMMTVFRQVGDSQRLDACHTQARKVDFPPRSMDGSES